MIEAAIEAHYIAAQQSFAALARSLRADEWSVRVPCTPAWTVRDVLSHVSGITDDALAGRLDGVATEPWTASQVERHRDAAIEGLLARWEEQAPGFAATIASMGEVRPPIDCHAHEHDVRHALARPGNRDSAIIDAAVASMVNEYGSPLIIELSDGRTFRDDSGAGVPVTLAGVSAFEVFRSRLGRRSAAQVRAYRWSGPEERLAEVLDDWFIFGPAAEAIVEDG